MSVPLLPWSSFYFGDIPICTSLDNIQQRRSDVAWLEQKNSLDIKNCDGKACVRIMKNNCHGINKDYCVIDPK